MRMSWEGGSDFYYGRWVRFLLRKMGGECLPSFGTNDSLAWSVLHLSHNIKAVPMQMGSRCFLTAGSIRRASFVATVLKREHN